MLTQKAVQICYRKICTKYHWVYYKYIPYTLKIYVTNKFCFNDELTAEAIMRSSEPAKMKALSHQIKKLEDARWKPHARKTMERACFLKFSQNPRLKERLLASQGTLVECNRRDNFFSCGLALSHPNILDSSRWLGQNILGEILTSLRGRLQEE